MSSQHGLKGASVEPRVSLLLRDTGTVSLLLRVPAPARDKGTVEQRIIRGFLERMGDDAQSGDGAESPSAGDGERGGADPVRGDSR